MTLNIYLFIYKWHRFFPFPKTDKYKLLHKQNTQVTIYLLSLKFKFNIYLKEYVYKDHIKGHIY